MGIFLSIARQYFSTNVSLYVGLNQKKQACFRGEACFPNPGSFRDLFF
jgi:hypothetical protein